MITPTQFPTALVQTHEGHEFRVRPIHPDDKWMLADGFQKLSPESRYARFMLPSDRLSSVQLAYLTEVDFHNHVAWGVIDGEEAVGVARFIRLDDEPNGADVAVTVLDSHQRQGIGPMLLRVLALSAGSRGISRFHFDVLAENSAMLTVLSRLGADVTSDGDLAHAVLEVQQVPPPHVVTGDLGDLVGPSPQKQIG